MARDAREPPFGVKDPFATLASSLLRMTESSGWRRGVGGRGGRARRHVAAPAADRGRDQRGRLVPPPQVTGEAWSKAAPST